MNRIQQILAGLLVVQAVLAGVVFWPQAEAPAVDVDLMAFDPETVTGLIISAGPGDEQPLRLQKQNGTWILANSGSYPAREGQIEAMLAQLSAATAERLVAQTESSHGRLEVADDDYRRRITVETAAGDRPVLYVGQAPNPRTVNVRPGGGTAVYLTSDFTLGDFVTGLSAWVDATYLAVDRAAITRMVLENENGTFEMVRDDGGAWTLADATAEETIDPARAELLAGRLARTTFLRPLGTDRPPGSGLSNPQATLAVTIEDGETGEPRTAVLQVGNRVDAADGEAEAYYVKWSESDYYVLLSAFNTEALVNTTRADFSAASES